MPLVFPLRLMLRSLSTRTGFYTLKFWKFRMKCAIPIEITRTIEGRGRVLECVPSLFPSYLPDSKILKGYISELSDENHLIESVLIRSGHYTFVTTNDQKIGLNTYLIPSSYSDKYVVSYFKKHQGWSRYMRPRIAHPLKYKGSRHDPAKTLYQWELDTFGNRQDPYISEKQARSIAKHYLQVLEIYNYSIVFEYFNDLYSLAECRPVRRSGIVAKADSYLLRYSPDKVSASTVLHEIAHIVDYERYRALGHGPTFMLIFNMLLRDYFGKSYLSSMREAGLFKGKRNGR